MTGTSDILSDGQRKLLTVLFADIGKSSEVVGGADPEDANDELLEQLQAMIDAVHRYGGTVTQILGDGVLALFGAPHAQEHHALRACLAAEAIHARAHTGTGTKRRGARVGLDSGEVVASLVRNDISHEFRAAGETMHVAQRMEGLAEVGSTFLTERTRRLVAEHVEVERRPAPYSLGGAAKPVHYARLLRVAPDAPPFQQFRRRQLGSLIGRDRELTLLTHALDDAQRGRGRGRFVVVRGDAGIGKTRLVFEFIEAIRGDAAAVVECNFRPSGLAHPHGAMACVVRGIEQVFAKLKAILRKVGARTVDDLWRAIGNALDEFSPTECRNYLVNAGYSV